MTYSFRPFPIIEALQAVSGAVALSVILLVSMVFIGSLAIPLIILVWAVALFRLISIFTWARYQVITLGEDTVKYQRGIISRDSVELPYARITEKGFSQGLLERMFGVGRLRLDTAGGTYMAIYLPDVRENDMQKAIDMIGKKTKAE